MRFFIFKVHYRNIINIIVKKVTVLCVFFIKKSQLCK